MADQIAFDNERYILEQTGEILERVDWFNNKLYLEFGGKLLYDCHAARVLPGYNPNVKMRLLQQLKDRADLRDFNINDPFHQEAYDRKAVNSTSRTYPHPATRRASGASALISPAIRTLLQKTSLSADRHSGWPISEAF